MYKFIEHTADMGIEARGTSLAETIEEAAHGLIIMIFGELPVSVVVRNDIVIRAEDPVELLVSTLNEIVCQVEIGNLVPAGLNIEFLSETELRGKIPGECFDADRHIVEREVKSVTYHRACLEEDENGFHTRVYVDL